MTDKTINQLTTTTTAAAADLLPIWVTGSGVTRAVTKANFMGGAMTGGGTVATGGFTLTVPATGTAALLESAFSAETGTETPGAGNSFDSTLVIAASTIYALVIGVIGGLNTATEAAQYVIFRQGTGTTIREIAASAYCTVSCSSSTSYEVRITNSTVTNWTYTYSLMRIR